MNCPFCNLALSFEDDLYCHTNFYNKTDHFYSLLIDNNKNPEEEFVSNGKYELITVIRKNIYTFSMLDKDENYLYSVNGNINNQSVVTIYNNLIKRVELIKAFE